MHKPWFDPVPLLPFAIRKDYIINGKGSDNLYNNTSLMDTVSLKITKGVSYRGLYLKLIW